MVKTPIINRNATSNKKNTNRRPWFDSSCKNKRLAYLNAKNTNRRFNSAISMDELKVASKGYIKRELKLNRNSMNITKT